jgi:excisionase family DNA binding protein
MVSSGILIEGITRQEFMDYMERVMEAVQGRVSRREYSVSELSGLTGYSPAHLRKLIKDNDIPFRKTGKQIYVPHESLTRLPNKLPPGLIPS